MIRSLLTLLAFTMPLVATGTTYSRAYDVAEMSDRAETVVIGEVQGTWTESAPDGWWTVAAVLVNETLQGDHQAVVEVRYPGGQVGDLHLVVSGAPALKRGDEVVVLTTGENGRVLGLSQGVWKIQEDQHATRDLSFLTFKEGGQPVERLPLAELKRLLR